MLISYNIHPSLPLLADIIVKIKQLEELTAEEDLVYLMYVEHIPEAEAREIIIFTYRTGPSPFA